MTKKTKTQKKLRNWKVLRGFLATSKYAVAELPATIMLIIKRNEWCPTVTETARVSTGFAMFCITMVITVLCIAKREEIFKKMSPLYIVSFYLIIFGVIALFLAHILDDLGWLGVFTGVGLAVAATEDTVNKKYVAGKIDYWNGVLSDAGLNIKENNLKKKKEADIKKARDEALNRAVE